MAAGLEPATLCLEGVIWRFLLITLVVCRLCKTAIFAAFARIGDCCRFHSFSGRDPYIFHHSEKKANPTLRPDSPQTRQDAQEAPEGL